MMEEENKPHFLTADDADLHRFCVKGLDAGNPVLKIISFDEGGLLV
jgi:hypothetical protein